MGKEDGMLVLVSSAGKTYCKLYHFSFGYKKSCAVGHTYAEWKKAHSLSLRNEKTEKCINRAETEGKVVLNNTGPYFLKSRFIFKCFEHF